MAKIFPKIIPDYIKDDPLRSSEVHVYEKLKEQLSDDFHVFYSSPWLGLNSDGSEIDGECDFTIAHELCGVLTIEVKGGRIGIDQNNQWWSTDRHDIRHKIKNPVEQARRSKFQFIEKFKQHRDLSDKFIRFNIGVILPDTSMPPYDIRPDMPSEIFAVNADMDKLDKWVESRLKGVDQEIENENHRRFDKLGQLGVQAITKMLAGQILLDLPIVTNVKKDLTKIQLKTDDQIHIIRELEDNKRMAISGAAGTGKTVLAIEKVKQLSNSNKRVLFLCYNQPLGKWFELIFNDNDSVKATNFHSLCHSVAKKAGKNTKNNKLSELETGFVDNFINSSIGQYDALVIDEGQDFETEWLMDLEITLKGGSEGVLYIFYDDNQKLKGNISDYIFSLPYSKYRLRRNLRNTQKIFDTSNLFYEGRQVDCVGPDGEKVRFVEINNPSELGSVVRQKLGALINDEELPPSDITVLLPNSDYVSEISNQGTTNKIGRFEIADALDFTSDKIKVDTIRRFKGLESPIILLFIDDLSLKNIDLMYTGISRCQTFLIVIGIKKVVEGFKNKLSV